MTGKISRRNFLRGAVLASAGLAAAACQPAQPSGPAATQAPQGSPSQPKKEVKITWMVWGGVERYKVHTDNWARLYPETNAWLKVENVSPGSGEADSYKALRLALAAGGEGLPDICAFNYNGIPEFARGGHLLVLDNYMTKYQADLVERAKAVGQYEGKFIGVVNQLKPKVWFYRKDLFDKAGINPDTIKTWDELMAAANKFKEANPGSFMFNMGLKPAGYYYNEMLSHWDDSQFSDKSGNYTFQNNPNYKSVFQWLKQMGTTGISYNTDDFSTDWGPAFADNKIGSSLIAAWMTGFLPKYAPKQKGLWKLTLWPEFNRYGTDNGGQVTCVMKGSKNPDAAFEFISKMWLEAKGALAYWEAIGSPTCIKSGQEAIKAAAMKAERPAGMSDENWAVAPVNFFGGDFMDVVNKATDYVKVFPWSPKGTAEMSILQQHHQAYMEGKETLEESLNKAAADMKQQIGNPYA